MKSNLELYKSLYLIRYCEQKIIDLYHENEMRTPMHMSFGQEYIPVGVCSGLDMKCDITSSYRSHANFLAKTSDHQSFFFEMYGKEEAVGKGKCGSMHLGDPKKGHILSSGIVASQIPAATGLAFASKYKKQQYPKDQNIKTSSTENNSTCIIKTSSTENNSACIIKTSKHPQQKTSSSKHPHIKISKI